MDSNRLFTSPSKGGFTRNELNKIATDLGLDPKEFRTRDELATAIVELGSPSSENINDLIADKLSALAFIFSEEGERFRATALARAADIVRSLKFQISSVDQLKGIKGLGKGSLDRIEEILETGTLAEIDRTDNPEVSELLLIYGIGNKGVRKLNSQGIYTIEDLRNSGVPLTKNQRFGIEFFEELNERIPRKEVGKIGGKVLEIIEENDSRNRAAIVGSYRRGKKSSGDVDILMTNEDNQNNLREIVQEMKSKGILVHTFALGAVSLHGVYENEKGRKRKIDVRFVPIESWPTALLHSTGSQEFNVLLRNLAIERGLTLSEYGLFDAVTRARVPVKSEEEIMMLLEGRVRRPEDRDI